MARYDDTFVGRFPEPWNRHDVEGAVGADDRRLRLGGQARVNEFKGTRT
jgi:hypothetical protein